MTRLKQRTEKRIDKLRATRTAVLQGAPDLIALLENASKRSGDGKFGEAVRCLFALTRAESAFAQIAELKRVATLLSGLGPLPAMPALEPAEDDAALVAEVLSRLLLGPCVRELFVPVVAAASAYPPVLPGAAMTGAPAFAGRREFRPAGEGGENVVGTALRAERHVATYAARLVAGPPAYDAAVPPLLALLAFLPAGPALRPHAPAVALGLARLLRSYGASGARGFGPAGEAAGGTEGETAAGLEGEEAEGVEGEAAGAAEGTSAGAVFEAQETAKALLLLLQRRAPELRADAAGPRSATGSWSAAVGSALLCALRAERPLSRDFVCAAAIAHSTLLLDLLWLPPEDAPAHARALRAAFFPTDDGPPDAVAAEAAAALERVARAAGAVPDGAPLACFTTGGPHALPPLARVAAVRALLAAAPASVLCAPLGGGRTLLLPSCAALCDAAEAVPPDPPLRCFALHATGLLLDRLRAGLASGAYGGGGPAAGAAGWAGPLRAALERLLRVAWSGWDDPFPGIASQARAVLDAVLAADALLPPPDAAAGPPFTSAAADALLAADPNARGRYGPLAALLPRVGAGELLRRRPALLLETVSACADGAVAPAAAGLWTALLDGLRRELAAAGPAWEERWAATWLPALSGALQHPLAAVRRAATTHLLPAALSGSPAALPALLAALAPAADGGPLPTGRLRATVAVLRVARAGGLLAGADLHAAAAGGGGGALRLPAGALAAALEHVSGEVRLEALELLCASARSCERATATELGLLRAHLPAQLKSSDATFRQARRSTPPAPAPRPAASGSSRTSAASSPASATAPAAPPPPTAAATAGRTARSSTPPRSCPRSATSCAGCCMHAPPALPPGPGATGRQLAADSLFPGASFERRVFALELYSALVDVFGADPNAAPPPPETRRELKKRHGWADGEQRARAAADGALRASGAVDMRPLLFTRDLTGALLDALADGFDRVRELAFEALARLPAPLPGFEAPAAAAALIRGALDFAGRPRRREADAGALLLRVLHAKLAAGLGWTLRLYPEPAAEPPAGAADGPAASAAFAAELLAFLRDQIARTRADRVAATEHAYAHGALLCLRYVLRDAAMAGPRAAAWRGALGEALRLAEEGAEAVAWAVDPVHAHRWAGAGPGPDVVDEMEDGALAGTTEQRLVAASWLSLKETALLVGTLAERAPPPDPADPAPLLSVPQLRAAGDLLLRLLLSTRHNGVVDKAHLALEALARRLAAARPGELTRLPSAWLEHTLHRMAEGSLYRLRRSAGLPFALLALLRAEPRGCARRLLPRAVAACLHLAAAPPDAAAEAAERQVYALNAMRALFQDGQLAGGMLPFVPDALVRAVDCFASEAWHVRNAATLCFVALVGRALGHKRDRQDAAQRQGSTAREFFLRYPALHPFLLARLEALAAALRERDAGVMNPAMYPLLALLARLVPSPVDEGALRASGPAAALGPFLGPVAELCGQRNHHAREMAARALVPLVARAALPEFAAGLLASLPSPGPGMRANVVHGRLLQVRELLRAARRSGDAPAARALAAGLAAPLRARALPLAGPACRCPPLRALALELVHEALYPPPAGPPDEEDDGSDSEGDGEEGGGAEAEAAAAAEGPETRALRRDAAAAAGAVLREPPPPPAAAGSAAGLWRLRSRAAALLLRGAAGAATGAEETDGPRPTAADVGRLLLRLLEDGSPDVRATALKFGVRWLEGDRRRAGTSSPLEGLAPAPLARALARLVAAEEAPKPLERALRALAALDTPPPPALWPRALALAAGAASPRVRGRALRLAALALREELAAGGAGLGERVAAFARLVDEGSGPERTVECRAAVVEALDAACLLLPLEAEGAPQTEAAVRAWLAALRLLQDDDAGVRAAAARAVGRATGGAAGLVPARAAEAAMAHVVAGHAPWPPLLRALFAPLAEAPPGTGLDPPGAPDPARRLFEREADNLHAEEVFPVQLTARHLPTALAVAADAVADGDAFVVVPLPPGSEAAEARCASRGAVLEAVAQWRRWLAAPAAAFAARCRAASGEGGWPGGPTRAPETFLAAYRILALAAALRSAPQATPGEADTALAPVVATMGMLLETDAHPLLRSLHEALREPAGSSGTGPLSLTFLLQAPYSSVTR